MNWAWDNRRMIVEQFAEHVFLAFLPVLLGLLIAIPLGLALARARVPRATVLGLLGLLHAIPALAFFAVLPGLLGRRLDDRLNVLVALTLLALAALARAVADAVAAVPQPVRTAAEALGLGTLGRALRVDLPVAMPGIVAGLRTVAVSSVSLVTVAALVGVGGLGQLLTEGFTTRFETEVLVGAALVVALALGADVFLVRVHRAFLPWAKPVPIR